MSTLELRPLGPGDDGALLATFDRVFADVDPARVPRDPAEWAWRFRANPAGTRVHVAADAGGIVGQVALVPQRAWVDGREETFAQGVDALLLPDRRRGHPHPGLFLSLARALRDEHGTPLVTFAFTGDGLGERMGELLRILLHHDVVRTETVLVRSAGATGETAAPAEVLPVERFDHQARWLWERCCGTWGASAVRDDAFLNWRLLDRPGAPYTVLGVEDGEGVLRGYAAYRAESALVPGAATLVDWLVPPEEPEVGELLLRALLARMHADGAGGLAALIPEWSPWFDAFQRWGFLVRPSELVLYARSTSRRLDEIWLRNHWWYQPADTDLA